MCSPYLIPSRLRPPSRAAIRYQPYKPSGELPTRKVMPKRRNGHRTDACHSTRSDRQSRAPPAFEASGCRSAWPGRPGSPADIVPREMRIFHREHAGRPVRVAWMLEELGEPYELTMI